MKTAIAVMSCLTNKDRRDAIRNTWLRDVPYGIDTNFYVGGDCPDTISLPCNDGYDTCAVKQFEMIKKLDAYDHVFFCDDDTYIVPERLLLCGYESHDYMGCPVTLDDGLMAQGGAGFWLSRRAMGAVLEQGLEGIDTTFSDRAVARWMRRAGIQLKGDFRFNSGKYNAGRGFCNLTPNRFNLYITTHFVSPELAQTIYDHFHKGTAAFKNGYPMTICETRVDFSESRGRWWFMIAGDTRFCGEFDTAQQAELEAMAVLRNRLLRSTP